MGLDIGFGWGVWFVCFLFLGLGGGRFDYFFLCVFGVCFGCVDVVFEYFYVGGVCEGEDVFFY